MRLTRIFLLTLVAVFVAAVFSVMQPPAAFAVESSDPQPALRYGTPEAAYANGLSANEFFERFVDLRQQGKTSAGPTAPINSTSVVANAVDNPPSVSEVLASTTSTWLGFSVFGRTLQTMGAAEVLYMAWPDSRNGGAGLFFSRSLDGGLTWSGDQRVDRSDASAGEVGLGLNMAADNHGNVLLVWEDIRNNPGGQLFYSVSHDGGATWSAAAPIDPDSNLDAGVIDAAVDPAGNFYVVWHDDRSVTDFEIYSASSFDRGNTWQPEVKVSDPTGTTEVVPRIVATRDREIIIEWLSDRTGPNDDVFVARSTDGGATFSPDTRINSNAAGTLNSIGNRLCTDGHGNVYASYGLYTSGSGVGDVYTVVSNNFGLSWSAHNKITGARFYGLGIGFPVIDCTFDGLSGHVVVSFNGSIDGTTSDDAFVSVSNDTGATWQAAQRVNTGLAPLAGFDPFNIATGIDNFGHVITAWNDVRTGSTEIYFNYSNNFGTSWASTDIRMNGGTPGAHDAVLTNEAFFFFGPSGTPGTDNTNRLAFHNTFFDDRAGGVGLYDGILEFTGDMQVLTRLSGATRIETGIAINKDLFPAAGTSPAVVIGTSRTFPDALSAGPLAAMLNGSLLINPSDHLDSGVAAELVRSLDLKPGLKHNVYLVGGIAALSDQVAASLEALDPNIRIKRLAGADRYETSVRIAEEIDAIRGSGPTKALVTTGENFPDAISASAPGSDAGVHASHMPIVLVKKSSLPATVTTYLSSVSATLAQAYLIGGTAAISDDVLAALGTYAPTTERIWGADRYKTATAVASFFYTGALLPQRVGLASGEKFPDALGGGRASGAKHQPLVLTRQAGLPTTTSDYVSANSGSLDTGDVYGGPAAIDESIVGIINLLL